MRIAATEDKQNLTLELHVLLQKLGSHSIVLFPEGGQLLFAWEEQPYDPVFPNIQMKGINGLKIARKVQEKGVHVYLVFLTNGPSLVFEGYEVSTVRYWLKLVQEGKFCQLSDQLETPRTYLLWSIDGELRKLYEKDTCCLESNARCMCCHHHKEIPHMEGSLQKECTELPNNFLNCYRSCCVNLNHVHALRKDDCVLGDQECILVSRGTKQQVQEEIMKRYKRGLLCRS